MTEQRRFLGTQTLYQEDFEAFRQAHIYVIGVGGVGSWATEALARTGVGKITLVDMDVLVESNVNRQLPALSETFGESKIAVMAERAKQINPDIQIELMDDFLTVDNVASILPDKAYAKHNRVVVLDCVDDGAAKLAIALHCRFNKVKLVVSGGVGGKIDPMQIRVDDLREVSQDPLLARLRHKLREKNINQALKEKFHMKCVYSIEPLKMATACQSGLNCGGYGSAVVVTATVGMIMAAEALKIIAKSNHN